MKMSGIRFSIVCQELSKYCKITGGDTSAPRAARQDGAAARTAAARTVLALRFIRKSGSPNVRDTQRRGTGFGKQFNRLTCGSKDNPKGPGALCCEPRGRWNTPRPARPVRDAVRSLI